MEVGFMRIQEGSDSQFVLCRFLITDMSVSYHGWELRSRYARILADNGVTGCSPVSSATPLTAENFQPLASISLAVAASTGREIR